MATAANPGAAAAGIDLVAGMDDSGLILRYRKGLEMVDARVFELSDEQLDMAFLPDAGVGNWPVRVLIGHLADAELAYTHRMRRAVAEENPVVNAWDENAFVDAGLYAGGQHPIAGFIAVIHTTRRWTAEWLSTLTSEQLQRRVMHETKGEMTVRRMLAMTTWHLEHHVRFLNSKICKFLGPAPEGGSCGAGCGCGKK
jgi:uncharacterized damage-inducible protein DinB